LDTRAVAVEAAFDIPTTTTDVEAVVTAQFSPTVPTTLTTGPDQNYRTPTQSEVRAAIDGLHALAREAGKRGGDISTTDAAALLNPHGMTVTSAYAAANRRPYALVQSEATYPSSSAYRAWGWYLLDLTQPIRMLISAPHPQTDGNSEFIALRYAQKVPGSLFALSSVNRKAKDWLGTEVSTDHTGGTYTLTFRGQTTIAIAPGASTATIRAAVEALSTVGVGNAAVTGDPANTAYHAFIALSPGLYNSASPTDTITATSSLTGGTFLTLDHDADVAHNTQSVFNRVIEEFAQLGYPHLQLHGFADVSSGVPRAVGGILSPGSSNATGALEATRTALEAQGFDIYLKDRWDTQGIYFTGTPTGGTFTLTCGGVTTTAITFNTTNTTLAGNIQTALSALSTIGAGNVRVSVSQNANGTIPTLVITFTGALYHVGIQVTVATSSLTGGTAPLTNVQTPNSTGLMADSNAQGNAAETNGAIFLHLELSATVRTTTAMSAKAVAALANVNVPQLAATPVLAETGHAPSQVPLASGSGSTTGVSRAAARGDHRHPATTNSPVGNDLVARNSSDTAWTATAPNAVASTMTNVLHTTGDETATGRKGLLTPNSLTTGESVYDRELTGSSTLSVTSGTLHLVFFTALKTETTVSTRVLTGTTAAVATPTLCKMCLCTVAESGDVTIVAVTANNTGLFSVASQPYTEAWTASYGKTAGVRYARGILVVTAVATPTVVGYALASAATTESAIDPRLTARVTGQTDLVVGTVIPAASLLTTTNRHYGVILP
ncbi:MAG: hypothetical protein M3Q75_06490, partial [Gemmatimonadota bacterium]|nr:hypothetical protein [Gemmatimonadota bacterium]